MFLIIYYCCCQHHYYKMRKKIESLFFRFLSVFTAKRQQGETLVHSETIFKRQIYCILDRH